LTLPFEAAISASIFTIFSEPRWETDSFSGCQLQSQAPAPFQSFTAQQLGFEWIFSMEFSEFEDGLLNGLSDRIWIVGSFAQIHLCPVFP